jgi:hypothetical protein
VSRGCEYARVIDTWAPKMDRVPVPVLSVFSLPSEMILLTRSRYWYSSCRRDPDIFSCVCKGWKRSADQFENIYVIECDTLLILSRSTHHHRQCQDFVVRIFYSKFFSEVNVVITNSAIFCHFSGKNCVFLVVIQFLQCFVPKRQFFWQKKLFYKYVIDKGSV